MQQELYMVVTEQVETCDPQTRRRMAPAENNPSKSFRKPAHRVS